MVFVLVFVCDYVLIICVCVCVHALDVCVCACVCLRHFSDSTAFFPRVNGEHYVFVVVCGLCGGFTCMFMYQSPAYQTLPSEPSPSLSLSPIQSLNWVRERERQRERALLY